MAIMQKAELDQVFMTDAGILERIVRLSGIRKGETVLEVGAGTGNLTRLLAKKATKVIAIEKDGSLREALSASLAHSRNVRVIWGDALEVLSEGRLSFDRIVSNPPYSISEPLVKALYRQGFRAAVLTLPWRFVERLSANPEEPAYSKLSVFSQAFFRIETVLTVPRTAWSPRPPADGAVVRLTPRERPGARDRLAMELALQEDKKLKNALREALVRISKSTKRKARAGLEEAGIPEKILDRKISEIPTGDFLSALEKAGALLG